MEQTDRDFCRTLDKSVQKVHHDLYSKEYELKNDLEAEILNVKQACEDWLNFIGKDSKISVVSRINKVKGK
jgi:hypothetical protein